MRRGCYEYTQNCKWPRCKHTFHCCSQCGLNQAREPQINGYCSDKHYQLGLAQGRVFHGKATAARLTSHTTTEDDDDANLGN